jgi:hypothetical protein
VEQAMEYLRKTRYEQGLSEEDWLTMLVSIALTSARRH